MLGQIEIVQFDPTPGDIEGNSRRMAEAIGEAASRGSRVAVFPEEAVSGYCVGDLNRNRILIRESLAALEQRIAPATTRETAAVVGLIAPLEGRRLNDGAPGARNGWAVAQDGRVVGRGSKALLVDDGVFYDSRYFLPAQPDDIAPVPVDTPDGPCRLGVMVCHDMWDDYTALKPSRELQRRGADLLVVLNSSPYYVRRLEQRIETARRRVAETRLPLVYVNACSVQDNGKNVILFDGGSFVLDASGALRGRCPQFRTGSFRVDADLEPEGERAARSDELLDALLFGLRGFFARTGMDRAVIGLSGGIDSSVSAALLVATLGRDKVLGINMPSRFSSQVTRDNAAELARRLGMEYVVHPIEAVVRQKREEYEQLAGRTMETLTFENIQARERGNILMTYAQERGGLVIGNGNKTEFQRGYATLYGDIVGAVMPLGDLAKTDVYRLADAINRRLGDPIPEPVITIPPSAELSEEQDVTRGRGDPFDYDVEGPMGQEIIEMERTPAELRERFEQRRLDPEVWEPVRSDRSVYDKLTPDRFEALAWEVFRSIERTVFKRIQSPPVLKLSRKAFGFDLREAGFARLKF